MTGVNFGAWNIPGDTATTVDWSITTSAFDGTTVFSGTANVSQVFQFANQDGYDINLDSFGVADLPLCAGTFFLELQNAGLANGDPIYWDENYGSSLAYDSALGPVGSESFRAFSA